MIPLNFSWADAQLLISPLAQFVLGIVVYSIFVFRFYRFLASREVIGLNLQKYNYASHPLLEKTFAFFLWFFEFIVLFPLLILFWFGVLTILMSFLSPSQDISITLMIAFALVASVRITSYVSESLSQDLAKMLPFAMLGVFLLDVSAVELTRAQVVYDAFVSSLEQLPYYLLFIASIELFLRLTRRLVLLVRGIDEAELSEDK